MEGKLLCSLSLSLRTKWRPGRQLNSLRASGLAKEIRSVGDDAVDAELNHVHHVFELVDSPNHNPQAKAVGFGHERSVNVAEIWRPGSTSGCFDGPRQRATVIPRVEARRPAGRPVKRDGAARASLEREVHRRNFRPSLLDELQRPPVEGLDHDAVGESLGLDQSDQ